MKWLSLVQLLVTPWTVAYQAPPSMGFSRQEYWSGLQFPSPEDLPDSGIEPFSHIAGRRFTVWATREALTATKSGAKSKFGMGFNTRDARALVSSSTPTKGARGSSSPFHTT